jgi:hypothetical protein
MRGVAKSPGCQNTYYYKGTYSSGIFDKFALPVCDTVPLKQLKQKFWLRRWHLTLSIFEGAGGCHLGEISGNISEI